MQSVCADALAAGVSLVLTILVGLGNCAEKFQFTLLRKLGAGEFGAVYEARLATFTSKKTIACKEFAPGMQDDFEMVQE